MNRIKIALLSVFLLSPCVLAQSDISINGSVGYAKTVLDEFKDYPFRGIGFDFGASGYIFSGFGGSAGFNYASVSARDEADIELDISELDLYLIPKFRFGDRETHITFGMQISIPISNDATVKAPGYETRKLETEKLETSFMLRADGSFRPYQDKYGTLKYIDLGFTIGKVLTGIDRAIIFGPSLCFNAFCSNISYASGNDGSQFYLGIGFNYYLDTQQGESKYEKSSESDF